MKLLIYIFIGFTVISLIAIKIEHKIVTKRRLIEAQKPIGFE
jgi:hypothetical protein